MKTTIILASLLVLVSCGKDTVHTETVIKEVVTIPAQPTEPEVVGEDQDVANLIQDENDYRLGLGQTILSKGLSCTLYTFTGGDRIQASIANHNTLQGLKSVGSYLLQAPFNQAESSVNDGMNVMPDSLKNIYKTNYLLRCQGVVVVTDNDNYQFDLTSDDASVLYVGGSKVIDNDNAHGTTTIRANKYLRRGVHTIRVDYAQQGGSQSLILKMNEEVLKANKFFH